MTPRALRRSATLERMAAPENLMAAARRAMKGKRRRPDVEAWARRIEVEVLRLRDALLSGTWAPGGYRVFTIFEPKHRVIAAAPFGDRVVHHALCRVIQPLLERSFIARSYSCQLGKGTTAARECCRRLVNQHRWVLKCDVARFFPQIDHAVLTAKLVARIECPALLRVIARILSSHTTGLEIPAALFPGDDLAEVADRARGLPIGNLTSQLWGNFYLDGLDHILTESERHGAYLRYTDDFLLFGDDRARLWDLRTRVVAELASLRLRLSVPKSRLLACAEGIPFCGFRFLPDRQPRVLDATKRRFEARRHRMFLSGECGAKLTARVFGWYQFSREGNTEGLRRAYTRWPFNPALRRRRGRNRGLRGGSWNNDNRENLSSSNRNENPPDNRNNNNGFRCVVE